MSDSPLLLLHGALGAQSQLAPLAAVLAGGYDVRRLDFEGHGAAPDRGRPFSIPTFAENVLEFLDRASIARCDIFGHSMGGYVGVYLARYHSERVERVFTLGTKWDWSPAFAAREIRNMNPDRMLDKVPDFARSLAERHSGSDWRNNVDKSRDMTLEMGSEPSLSLTQLGEVAQRVRIGVGDRDFMTTVDESVAAYRALANGELQVFPATQHPIERVDVGQLCAAIEQFFD